MQLQELNTHPLKRLNIKQVQEMVGLKKSAIYQKVKEEKFPKPHKDGRSTFWFYQDIVNYLLQFK
ncbi:helix-turn-helix transcriptional regulator [Nitrosophilus labii]|uniref:helix-turn-helix transcriptional regulator n=1 Tax=Nitrosophilus labii TaxID=2706014 RepID=UPI001656DE4F|nr:AlpA family phage regulatory protein [Nitrosophilus labii]